MKMSFTRLFDKVIFKILTLLGCTGLFAACYGVREGNFAPIIQGNVNDPDGKPLEDISVTLHLKNGTPIDSTGTDEEGRFHFWRDPIDSTYIKAEDIDGPENGGWFNSDSTYVHTYKDRDGSLQARATNFTLKRKTSEEQE